MALVTILVVVFVVLTPTVTAALCNGNSGKYFNGSDCPLCSECKTGEVKVKNCTDNADTVCRPCSKCPRGDYIKKNCSTDVDTICDTCPDGTYSNDTDMFQCMLCSNCTEHGIEIRCNSTTDAKCKKGNGNNTGSTSVIIGVAVALGILIPAVAIVAFVIYKRRSEYSRAGVNENNTQDDNNEL